MKIFQQNSTKIDSGSKSPVTNSGYLVNNPKNFGKDDGFGNASQNGIKTNNNNTFKVVNKTSHWNLKRMYEPKRSSSQPAILQELTGDIFTDLKNEELNNQESILKTMGNYNNSSVMSASKANDPIVSKKRVNSFIPPCLYSQNTNPKSVILETLHSASIIKNKDTAKKNKHKSMSQCVDGNKGFMEKEERSEMTPQKFADIGQLLPKYQPATIKKLLTDSDFCNGDQLKYQEQIKEYYNQALYHQKDDALSPLATIFKKKYHPKNKDISNGLYQKSGLDIQKNYILKKLIRDNDDIKDYRLRLQGWKKLDENLEKSLVGVKEANLKILDPGNSKVECEHDYKQEVEYKSEVIARQFDDNKEKPPKVKGALENSWKFLEKKDRKKTKLSSLIDSGTGSFSKFQKMDTIKMSRAKFFENMQAKGKYFNKNQFVGKKGIKVELENNASLESFKDKRNSIRDCTYGELEDEDLFNNFVDDQVNDKIIHIDDSKSNEIDVVDLVKEVDTDNEQEQLENVNDGRKVLNDNRKTFTLPGGNLKKKKKMEIANTGLADMIEKHTYQDSV